MVLWHSEQFVVQHTNRSTARSVLNSLAYSQSSSELWIYLHTTPRAWTRLEEQQATAAWWGGRLRVSLALSVPRPE